MSSNDILVVGSGLEAHIVLQKLATVEFGGKLLHLPSAKSPLDEELFVASSSPSGPEEAQLSDVWGKKLLSLKLPPSAQFQFALPSGAEQLGTGLTVNRATVGESGVTATFSDGSEVLCRGVLFCDGPESTARDFWTQPVPARDDSFLVQCWSFLAANYSSVKHWDFRWSAAKSVEIVPLKGDKVRVRLRFKSPYGGNLTVAELADLFGEFGSEMTALFENVNDSSITRVEEGTVRAVHRPARGCLAIGRAAWASPPFLTFDWLSRFVEKQAEVLAEQLRASNLNEESFEAQSSELLKDLQESERYLRRHLHSDNIFLKPIRKLLLTLLPNSFWESRVKAKLYH